VYSTGKCMARVPRLIIEGIDGSLKITHHPGKCTQVLDQIAWNTSMKDLIHVPDHHTLM
jgi:hypothetical protein